MEHRHGQRIDIHLNVLIDVRHHQYGAGQVVSISHSGALVRTPLIVPLHARANLRLVTHSGNVSRMHILDAHVVGLRRDAVAFEWNDPDSAEISELLTAAARQLPLAANTRAAEPALAWRPRTGR